MAEKQLFAYANNSHQNESFNNQTSSFGAEPSMAHLLNSSNDESRIRHGQDVSRA
jgi:hypothetical protein